MADQEQFDAIREERKRLKGQQKHERITPQFDNTTATEVSLPLSAAMGLAATVVFLAFLWIVGKAGILGTLVGLFLERGWVPFVLTFLMFWSFAILVLKFFKIRHQRESMHYDLLPRSVAKQINQETVFDFEYHIKQLELNSKGSFLVTRIQRGLSYFGLQRDYDKTAQMLSSQSEIDATTVESSYTLLKVFIWAVPILGFIGTVIGISAAVANFAGALAAAKDMSLLKDSLGSVTSGLGVAFDTTLLGLVISLLLMFPASILQKQEEDMLNAVDEYCNEYFLKRLDDGRTPMDSWAGEPHDPRRLEFLQSRIEKLQESQLTIMEGLSSMVDIEDEDDELGEDA